jgi:hypothetical protein
MKSSKALLNVRLFCACLFFVNAINAQSTFLIPYRNGNLWGYCDSSKKIAIAPAYKSAQLFEGDYATVENDSGQLLINIKGKEITRAYKSIYFNSKTNQYTACRGYDDCALFDIAGKPVTPFYRRINAFNEDGFAVVEKSYGKQSIINKNGKQFTNEDYQYIELFKGKIAIVMDKNYKYGLIDLSTNRTVPCGYDKIYPFKEGLAFARKGDRYGFIDLSGREVIPFEYDRVPWRTYFGEQNFFEFNYNNFSEGLAVLVKDGKCGFINKNNEVVVPFEYETAYGFSHGLAWVSKDRQWGMINTHGKIVIPIQYDEYNSLSDKELEALIGVSQGLIRLRKDNLSGFADSTGRIVIPLTYDDVSSFHHGYAGFRKNELWGFLDRSGKEIIPAKYKYIYSADSYWYENPFLSGYAIVMPTDTTMILIDQQGRKISPITFTEVNYFNDGGYTTGFDSKNSYIINNKGEVMLTLPGRRYLTLYPNDLVYDYQEECYIHLRSGIRYKD